SALRTLTSSLSAREARPAALSQACPPCPRTQMLLVHLDDRRLVVPVPQPRPTRAKDADFHDVAPSIRVAGHRPGCGYGARCSRRECLTIEELLHDLLAG